MGRVLVGTDLGLRVFTPQGSLTGLHLDGRRVTSLAREAWRGLWVLLEEREVWVAGLEGWRLAAALPEGIRGNCLAPTRAGVLVGTAGARLFRLKAGVLEALESFERVPGRASWYTPWGGPPDTRSISWDERSLYVNVHVGGVVRSRDEGRTWEPTLDIDLDVHEVKAGRGRVLAATAEGLAVSGDGGDSWTLRAEGMHATYCRALALAKAEVLVSASEGPGGNRAAIYRATLSGEILERCRRGLPEWLPGNVDTHCLDAAGGLAAFGTEDGRVFVSADSGDSWSEAVSGLPGVNCLLVVP